MLGKLMKQEWLSTWKIPTVLIGVVFAAATIFGLFCASPVWDLMDWWGADVIFSATILLFYGALMCCELEHRFIWQYDTTEVCTAMKAI